MQKNCWDHKNCGRQPGGAKVPDLGVCPAATEARLNGKNSGKNAGRGCWVVAGTLCGGKVQGSMAEKLGSCLKCEFYAKVLDEEGDNFISSGSLLQLLK